MTTWSLVEVIWLLLVCRSFCLQFCLQLVRHFGLSSGEEWRISLFFLLKRSWVTFAGCSLWRAAFICLVAFGWIWAQRTAPYTPVFVQLLPSAVMSSVNTNDQVLLLAIFTHPQYCLHQIGKMLWCSRSWGNKPRLSIKMLVNQLSDYFWAWENGGQCKNSSPP